MTIKKTEIVTGLHQILCSPIAYHRIFAKVVGSATTGLFLSQAYYWSDRTNNEAEWFYKTAKQWREETELNRREQEQARKTLKRLGILEEKKAGVPAKLYFRVNKNVLYKRIMEYLGPPRTKKIEKEDLKVRIEKIISIYKSTLKGLSKAGQKRALKKGVVTEYVDYAEVLRNSNGICYLCNGPITNGCGQSRGDLQFDHILPIKENGPHIFSNIAATHAYCNLRKHCQFVEVEQTESQFVEVEQTGLSKSSKLLTKNTTKTTEYSLSTDSSYIAPLGAGVCAKGDGPAGEQGEPDFSSIWRIGEQSEPEPPQGKTHSYARAGVLVAKEPGETGRLFPTGKRSVPGDAASRRKNSATGRQGGKATSSRGCSYPISKSVFERMYKICFLAGTRHQVGLLTKGQIGQVAGVLGNLRDAGADLNRLDDFALWWARNWRSGKGSDYQPPRPVQVQELWSEAMQARDGLKEDDRNEVDEQATVRLREAMMKRAGSL